MHTARQTTRAPVLATRIPVCHRTNDICFLFSLQVASQENEFFTMSGGKPPTSPLLSTGSAHGTDLLLVPDVISRRSSSPCSTLSVPGSYQGGFSPMVGSQFDFTRCTSSTVSSIFDLTYEAETLDRAIIENDVKIVRLPPLPPAPLLSSCLSPFFPIRPLCLYSV